MIKRLISLWLTTIAISITQAQPSAHTLWHTPSPEGIPYRIPAIATTHDGDLIALTDYRYSKQDIGGGNGRIDILQRRSSDNGNTWGVSLPIAIGTGLENPSTHHFGCGYGDAAIVADRKSQEILIMCVSGKQLYTKASPTLPNCVAEIRSHDGGKTWSITDRTDYFLHTVFPGAYSMFFSSGRILQSRLCRLGKYHRIYAALPVNGPQAIFGGWRGCFVVFSDDFGNTWQVLGGPVNSLDQSPAPLCDESKLEELPNGDILISGRGPGSGRYFNVFHFQNYSKDKTRGTWGKAVATTPLSGIPQVAECNGEILCVKVHKQAILLQSIPTDPKRKNVSIFYKILDPKANYTPEYFLTGWHLGLQLTDKDSAYSTMTLQKDGRIGFYYEYGEWRDGGYDMVYLPLTIEQATGGAITAQKKKYIPNFDLEIGL